MQKKDTRWLTTRRNREQQNPTHVTHKYFASRDIIGKSKENDQDTRMNIIFALHYITLLYLLFILPFIICYAFCISCLSVYNTSIKQVPCTPNGVRDFLKLSVPNSVLSYLHHSMLPCVNTINHSHSWDHLVFFCVLFWHVFHSTVFCAVSEIYTSKQSAP